MDPAEHSTFPALSQVSAPLSERLWLTVQVVLLWGPEMVTVSGEERFPQITGSLSAANIILVPSIGSKFALTPAVASTYEAALF